MISNTTFYSSSQILTQLPHHNPGSQPFDNAPSAPWCGVWFHTQASFLQGMTGLALDTKLNAELANPGLGLGGLSLLPLLPAPLQCESQLLGIPGVL